MKRLITGIALALVAAVAVGLYAAERSSITVEPSQMRDGEVKTFTDDGKTITVTRKGDSTDVKIDSAGKTEQVTITREGDRVRIAHAGPDGHRTMFVGPDRKQIMIDGVPLQQFIDRSIAEARPRAHRMQTQNWFVCPKDHTMLRVPQGKEDQSYKCPVDGSTMEKRQGRGFTFFFDDDTFGSSWM